MKGRNELRLNQNSMIEAVEFYLNSKIFKDAAKVVNVTFLVNSGRHEYIVELQPSDATAESLGVGM